MSAQNDLLKAIQSGTLADVQAAVANGAELEHHYRLAAVGTPPVQYPDATALMLAIKAERPHFALELLRLGADPMTPHKNASRPFLAAAALGMDDVVRKIAERDPTGEASHLALSSALSNRRMGTAKLLLEMGAPVNILGYSPMQHVPVDREDDRPYRQLMFDSGVDISNRLELAALQRAIQLKCAQQKLEVQKKIKAAKQAAAWSEPLVENGKPTVMLNHLLGLDMLKQVFMPKLWEGRESDAVALFRSVSAAVNGYYRPNIEEIDMSAFHSAAISGAPEEKSAVERFVRCRKSGKESPKEGIVL